MINSYIDCNLFSAAFVNAGMSRGPLLDIKFPSSTTS